MLAELAAPVAERAAHELILVRLVGETGDLGAATALLHEWRQDLDRRGVTVRAAAFTSVDPGEDAVRLATKQGVDLVLVPAPQELLDEGILSRDIETLLSRAPCDVALFVPRVPLSYLRTDLLRPAQEQSRRPSESCPPADSRPIRG